MLRETTMKLNARPFPVKQDLGTESGPGSWFSAALGSSTLLMSPWLNPLCTASRQGKKSAYAGALAHP